jgi:hypothetical protein
MVRDLNPLNDEQDEHAGLLVNTAVSVRSLCWRVVEYLSGELILEERDDPSLVPHRRQCPGTRV